MGGIERAGEICHQVPKVSATAGQAHSAITLNNPTTVSPKSYIFSYHTLRGIVAISWPLAAFMGRVNALSRSRLQIDPPQGVDHTSCTKKLRNRRRSALFAVIYTIRGLKRHGNVSNMRRSREDW